MYYTPRDRESGPIRLAYTHPHAISGLGLEEKLLEGSVSKGQIQVCPRHAGCLVWLETSACEIEFSYRQE